MRMEEEDEGRLGAPLRHSLTSLGKRRPFSRKPSSWRHPGGTVSETEETDLSETESGGPELGVGEGRAGVTRHVHSFTFSSLSRLTLTVHVQFVMPVVAHNEIFYLLSSVLHGELATY